MCMPRSVMPPIDFFGEFRTPEEKARRLKESRKATDAFLAGLADGMKANKDRQTKKESGDKEVAE